MTPKAEELALADAVVTQIEVLAGMRSIYARVDLLEGTDGPVLLEVEVVDPCLSLDVVPDAARHLARAVIDD